MEITALSTEQKLTLRDKQVSIYQQRERVAQLRTQMIQLAAQLQSSEQDFKTSVESMGKELGVDFAAFAFDSDSLKFTPTKTA